MPPAVTKGQDFYLFNNRIYIPPDLQEDTIQHIHAAKAHGHFGIYKTYQRLRETYDFPGSLQKVKDTLHKCTTCARSKASRHKPYGELQVIPLPHKSWNSIALDFIVKLPLSKEPMTGFFFIH
jgi:Integrase zinc binding domain